MKSTIVMNNALKFYKEQELVNNSEFYKEKLSEDINSMEYDKMIDRMYSKRFLPKSILSASI